MLFICVHKIHIHPSLDTLTHFAENMFLCKSHIFCMMYMHVCVYTISLQAIRTTRDTFNV